MAKLYGGDAEQAKPCLLHGLRLNSRLLVILTASPGWTSPGSISEAVNVSTKALHVRPAWHVTLETLAIWPRPTKWRELRMAAANRALSFIPATDDGRERIRIATPENRGLAADLPNPFEALLNVCWADLSLRLLHLHATGIAPAIGETGQLKSI